MNHGMTNAPGAESGQARPEVLGFLAAALLFASGLAWGCDNPIRDTALKEWPREPGYLFILFDVEDYRVQELRKSVSALFQKELQGSNLEVRDIDVSNEKFNPQRLGLTKKPERLPAIAVSFWDQSVDGVRVILPPQGKFDAETLKQLIDSPARKELREALVRKIGALVFLPGPDAQAAKTAKATILAAQKKLKQKFVDVALLVLDPARVEGEEAAFARMLTIREAKEPAVAMIFGRGKVVHQTLVGKEITVDRLWEICSVPLGPCLCSVTPDSIGYDLIMDWPAGMEEKVIATAEVQNLTAKEGGQELPADPAQLDELLKSGPDGASPAAAGAPPTAEEKRAAQTRKAEKELDALVKQQVGPQASEVSDLGGTSQIFGAAVALGLIFLLVAGGVMILGRRRS